VYGHAGDDSAWTTRCGDAIPAQEEGEDDRRREEEGQDVSPAYIRERDADGEGEEQDEKR
jgi:hypothetical protein